MSNVPKTEGIQLNHFDHFELLNTGISDVMAAIHYLCQSQSPGNEPVSPLMWLAGTTLNVCG